MYLVSFHHCVKNLPNWVNTQTSADRLHHFPWFVRRGRCRPALCSKISCYWRTSTWVCKQDGEWMRAAILRAQWYEGSLSSPGSICQCPVSESELHPEELGVLGRILQRCGGGRRPVGGGRPGVAGGQCGALEAGLSVLRRPRRQRGEPREACQVWRRQCGAAFLSPVFIPTGEGGENR